ncbi:MAG: TIGR02449 family protein [Gammaproteobacteria bacterium]|nr:TIGR02449 family protein [Gammaproteobacteria bacterium]
MKTLELNHLETQIDHMMRLIDSLQLENAALKQKMAMHIQERTRAQYKNQRASKQIKQIIKTIKEELS